MRQLQAQNASLSTLGGFAPTDALRVLNLRGNALTDLPPPVRGRLDVGARMELLDLSDNRLVTLTGLGSALPLWPNGSGLCGAERLLLAEADVRAARELLISAIDEETRGQLRAAKSSALKLHCSDVAQRIIAIAFDALGPRRAARFVPLDEAGREQVAEDAESNFIHNYLFYRSRTIAGGTSEVQKNVIARELFGV